MRSIGFTRSGIAKAAAFVSYGSVMGAREHPSSFRETAIELQMAPLSDRRFNIPPATLWAHFQGADVEKGLAELEKQARHHDRRSSLVDGSSEGIPQRLNKGGLNSEYGALAGTLRRRSPVRSITRSMKRACRRR